MPETNRPLHATAIRYADKALLIRGPSSSGKSTLALQLIGAGAALIADDQVILRAGPRGVEASCPPQITGLIEARGIGVLNTPAAHPAPIAYVVDMGIVETERVPPQRHTRLLGDDIALIHRVDSPHFPVSLLQLMLHGRSNR